MKYVYIMLSVLIIATLITLIFLGPDNQEPSKEIQIQKDTIRVHIPIFESDTVLLNGYKYIRYVCDIDTTYAQRYDGKWYQRVDITSDLKEVE